MPLFCINNKLINTKTELFNTETRILANNFNYLNLERTKKI